MSTAISPTQHAQLSEFIRALSDRDMHALQVKFNLTEPVIREIFEAMLVYFAEGSKLSAPPLVSQYEDWSLIAVYKTDAGDIAVDCYVMENDEPGEAILHVVFFAATPNELLYGFINS